MQMRKLLLASIFIISACSHLPDWLGAGNDDVPLPGERISVIDSGINLSPDAQTAAEPVVIGNASVNFDAYKTYEAGNPAAKRYIISAPPVIADGRIFIIDGIGTISAYKLEE